MSDSGASEHAIAAVTAAEKAGRQLGLNVTDPTILYDVFSVVVHLKPSPVVARVPTMLPPGVRDTDYRLAKHRREIAVTSWLANNGHPVTPPSPLVPREPMVVDGLTLSMWQWFEQDHGAEPNSAVDTASIADLHKILRDYDEPLPYFAAADVLEKSLRSLAPIPDVLDAADLKRAWRDWEILKPLTVSAEGLRQVFPNARVQPIHGDAPSFNLLKTTSGPLFADFEEVMIGPVEWDLTLIGDESVAVYEEAAMAHGAPLVDRRLLAAMEAIRTLQVVACLTLIDDMPILATGTKSVLDRWRSNPVAPF